MKYDTIKETLLVQGILLITLNRPYSLNSLNGNIIDDLITCINHISKYQNLKALILTGNGRAFSSGADLKERLSLSNVKIINRIKKTKQLLKLIESLNMPTIAAINGIALGGGLELALSCDFRLMSNNTYIGLTECSLGIIPGAGGTQRLIRLIGYSKAKQIIYSGKMLSARDALLYDLIDRYLTNFIKDVIVFAKQFVCSAPLSIKAAKKSITYGLDLPLSEALKLETTLYKVMVFTYDKTEGLKAFREKRKPVFIGK